MDTIVLVFQAVFLAFVVTTMFHVGLVTTTSNLIGVLRNVRWLIGAVVASLVAVPLVGWGIAEAFPLEGATFVALVLVASSPGAPFSVALTGIGRGDLVAGAATMAILAVIGSVTTPITVDLIVSASDVTAAGGGSIDVAQLVRSIVLLQIVPFGSGMAVKAWTPTHADQWEQPVNKISSVTFGIVLLGIVLGGFQQILDLLGSWIIVAALVSGLTWFAVGALLAPGTERLRATGGLVAWSRNAGPVLLIALASFADVEGVIPAVIAVYITQLVSQLVTAAWLGKRHSAAGAPGQM